MRRRRLRSRTRSTVLAILWLGSGWVAGQDDGRLQGQVTDNATGLPIEGVTIQLDLHPADGTPEQTVRSDAFGFFRQTGLAAGDYDLKFLHPAYATATVTDVAIANGAWHAERASLTPVTPVPGAEPIDLTIQVRGAVSNWGMQEVPVRVQRFASVGDTLPTHDFQFRADEFGFVRYHGAPSGYYRVIVNEPEASTHFTKWETFTTEGTVEDKQLISQSHLISVYLKPVLQTITFDVIGYNFKKRQHLQPLEDIIVECTGRSPTSFGVELLPPQVDVTDENGRVTFRGLPGIEYYVEFKRLGYFPESRLVKPTAQGELPSAPASVELGTYSHKLALDLQHNYSEPETMLITLPVMIEGQPGTNADGIAVEGNVSHPVVVDSSGYVTSGVAAEQMMIGNYRVSPRGAGGNMQFQFPIANGGSNHFFSVNFLAEGDTDADIPESLAWNETRVLPYPITIKRTRVTGRVVSAEHCVAKAGDMPVFLPLGGVSLTFREKSGVDVLPVDSKEVTVVTSPDGEYTVDLFPGVYGMEVDGEPADHMAIDLIKKITANPYGFPGGSSTVPWPVVDLWPDPGTVYSQTYWSPGGLVVNGTEEIDLEVRLQREVYGVESQISVDHDALKQQVIFDPGGGSGQYTVQNSDLLSTVATIVRQEGGTYNGTVFLDSQNKPRVRWGDLPPGTYTASLSHPRYTFTSGTTLTLRDWPNAGEIPAGGSFDASSGINFRDSIPLGIYEIPISATLTDPEQPSLSVKYWSESQGQYFSGSVGLRLLKPDFSNSFFTVPTRVTSGAWTAYFWDTRNNVFYHGRSGDTIFIDGPSATAPGDQPDLGSFDVEVIAFMADDPDEAVSGVNFRFNGGSTVHQTPATFTEFTSNPGVLKATGVDTWIWRTPRPAIEIDTSGPRPLVRHRLPVSRALNFDLTITNPVTAAPVEGALVEFFTADGARIMNGVSAYDSLQIVADENGRVASSGTTYIGDYMIRVSSRGYAPQRFRFDADDATPVADDPYGSIEHVATLQLQPLASPTLLTSGIPFDRYGAFIPGLRRSGDQSAFNGFSAEPVLTTTWEIRFSHPLQSYSVNTFDESDGSPGTPTQVTFEDPVQYVWLVDEREFEKNFFNGDPVESFFDEPENVHAIHAYLRRMEREAGSSFPPKKQYFQKHSRVEATTNPGVFRIEGKSPLWLMPPGDFKPVFIVETRAGAVSMLRPDYSGADMEKRLTGVPIPPWLGFAFDVMSVTAGSSATQETLKKYVPNGKFLPFPDFTATIARHKENGQDTNYIDYTFGLTVVQREGQDSPAGDVSGLAAGILGAEFKTTATITMPGKDRRLDLAVASNISKDDISSKSYEPKAFKGFPVSASVDRVSGSVTTTAAVNADPLQPWDLRLTNDVTASIDGTFQVDMRPFAEKVPYVGPVLGALRAAAPNSYQLDGISTVGIGLENKLVWETLKPSKSTGGTITAETRARRRHFLGGNEPDLLNPPAGDPGAPVNDPDEFNLCFRFGVGMSGGVGDGTAGARASLNLTGNTCGGEPSVKTEFNSLGQWPPIRRISGSINASASGFLNTPVKKFEKAWSWNVFKFDSQFGTENLIEFIPMEVTQSVENRSATTPGQFLGRGPRLVTGLGGFSLAGAGSGDNRFMLWADYDPANDRMVLKLSEATGPFTWGTPFELATGQLIRNIRRLALADGRHLVVWSGHNDASGNPFAAESISFAVSDNNGGNWSSPALVASLEGRANQLELAQSGSLITVAWAEGPAGPFSDEVSLHVCDFVGNAWESPVELADETLRSGFVVLAGGASAPSSIEVVTMQDVLSFGWTYHLARSHSWNGSSAATPVDIFALQNVSVLAGYATPDGARVLFGKTPSAGMVRAVSNPGATTYSKDFAFALAAQPIEMRACHLDDPVDPVALLTWTEIAEDARQIRYAFITPGGTVMSGPEPLTGNRKGAYTQLSVMPDTSRSAAVAAWFTNSPSEFRVFSISADTGIAGNDADGDGMNDLVELWIVDFDSLDSISDIDDVLPGDDFDNDGFSNGDEADAGSDPTDPASVPGPGGVTIAAGNDAAEYELRAGTFVVGRPSGDIGSALQVYYETAGTATAGTDYVTLPGMVEIPSGSTTAQIIVSPLADSAPEGTETVEVTLLANGAYELGSPISASVGVRDLPMDDWRRRNFGAMASNPAVAGDLVDPDADTWSNLLEYALVKDPSLPDGFGTPQMAWWKDTGTGKHYLQLTYTEAAEAEDITILVESSGLPEGWNSGSGHTVDMTADPAPTDGAGNAIRTIRDAVAREDAPLGRRFLRIRVVKN